MAFAAEFEKPKVRFGYLNNERLELPQLMQLAELPSLVGLKPSEWVKRLERLPLTAVYAVFLTTWNGYSRNYDQLQGTGEAADAADIPVINAGDGAGQHPTQALLDAFTMRQKKGRIAGLRVALISKWWQLRHQPVHPDL